MLHPVGGSNNLQWPQTRPGSNQSEPQVTAGAVFANAQLLAATMNGGLTETMALPGASPAVDAGTSNGSSLLDQRGLPRLGTVDIGAYELQANIIFKDGFEGVDTASGID